MFIVPRKNRALPYNEIWEILSDKPNGEVVYDCIKEKKAFSELRECFKMLEE
jgi:DNA-binding HxlR family transcriptional regulator